MLELYWILTEFRSHGKSLRAIRHARDTVLAEISRESILRMN